MKTYNVILKFSSIVKLTTIIGLCCGILSIPLALIVGALRIDPRIQIELNDYLQLIIALPLQGIIGGAFVGILGFPLYKLYTNKFGGIELKGEFSDSNK